MKKIALLLAAALTVFAVGCSDSSTKKKETKVEVKTGAPGTGEGTKVEVKKTDEGTKVEVKKTDDAK